MTEPTNKNMLSSLDFKVNLKRAPTVSYFCQRFVLPGISLPMASRPTPFVKIPEIGDHIEFEPLTLTFKVDEDLANWQELFDWAMALGFPENWEQHQALPYGARTTLDTQTTDISVVSTTNARNPNRIFTFKDAWITNLSSVDFTTTETALQYVEATATFNYTYYTVT